MRLEAIQEMSGCGVDTMIRWKSGCAARHFGGKGHRWKSYNGDAGDPKRKKPRNSAGLFSLVMEISCLLAGVSRYRIMNTDYDGAKPLR